MWHTHTMDYLAMKKNNNICSPLAHVPARYREASGILTSGSALPSAFIRLGPELGATEQSEGGLQEAFRLL